MPAHSRDLPERSWQKSAGWAYRVSLTLYPKAFRREFGAEMNEVFNEALRDQARKGFSHTLLFLGREMVETPGSILTQRLAENSFWARPYPMAILAFTFGFALLGLLAVLNFYQALNGMLLNLLTLLVYLLIGGLGGQVIGIFLDPRHKSLFCLCGAAGFLLANTLGPQVYFLIDPDRMAAPKSGIYFLVPFLYPILIGGIFGLFIGLANRNWRGFFRYIGVSCLALLAGFFVNRLSDALMESFLFHNTFQGIAQSGQANLWVYLLFPYLLEGILLGAMFGGSARRGVTIRA